MAPSHYEHRRTMSTAERPPGRLDRQGFTEAAKTRLAQFDPDPDLDAMAVVLLLMRAATEVMNLLEARVHRPAGWSWAGFRVLFSLLIAGPLAPNQLASALRRKPGVDVVRAQHPGARRPGHRARSEAGRQGIAVDLTETGRPRSRRRGAAITRSRNACSKGSTPAQRLDITTLLDSLLAAAGEQL